MMDDVFVRFYDSLPGEFHADTRYTKVLEKAYTLAQKAHQDQYRKIDNSPYILHPLAVATIVGQSYGDKDLVLAAVLHDTVEDSVDVSMEMIYTTFGDVVGFLVDAVTKDLLHFHTTPHTYYSDKIEKLLAGGLLDVRCLLLKLADRQHNVQTISGLKNSKQIRMSFETQAIYQPLKELLAGKKDISALPLSTININKDQFVKEHTIDSATTFKQVLYSQAFENFDNTLFSMVYNNSHKVVWKISDRYLFDTISSKDTFMEFIDVIQMQYNEIDGFEVLFTYKKGKVFDMKGKMGISGFIDG